MPEAGAIRAGARLRWGVAILCGAVVGIAVVPLLGVVAGLLSSWAALALIVTIWVLFEIWPMNAQATREHATGEDPGRHVARVVAVVGSVVSLGAMVVVVVQARRIGGAEAFVLAGIALLSVVSSWALIQVNYLLHYARVYYEGGPEGKPLGGIDFNQVTDPEYTDFVYFSVGLGMTYQVADTSVTRNAIRRIVIAQTLLAYLFGAGIIAAVINLIAGLG